MFVRYDCGCIGIRKDGEDLVLRCCDVSDGPSESFYKRNMSDKTCEPISAEDEARLIQAISERIRDGYQLSVVRAIMRA